MATASMVRRLAFSAAVISTACSTLVDGIATSGPQKDACTAVGIQRVGARFESHCVQGLDVPNGECEIAQCVGVGDAAAIAQTYCFDAAGERVACPTFDSGVPLDASTDADVGPDAVIAADAEPPKLDGPLPAPDVAPPEPDAAPAGPTVAQQQFCAVEAISARSPIWSAICLTEVEGICTLAQCEAPDGAPRFTAIASVYCCDGAGDRVQCPPSESP